MGALEVILLIAGGIVFTVSFLIPAGKADNTTREIVQDEVKNAVAREMDGMKGKIEDLTEETVSHAMEKTERSLERVSNEKIMAVNEYSDTVLEEINKNHKEVMFLYDMLNDKHQNIKNTVSNVEKTVKEVEQKAKEVENTVQEAGNTVQEIKSTVEPENEKTKTTRKKQEKIVENILSDDTEKEVQVIKPAKKPSKKASNKNVSAQTPELDISFMKGVRNGNNNNEKILELHKAGKSNIAIAKELGLGVGEVKLVIDLFEGM